MSGHIQAPSAVLKGKKTATPLPFYPRETDTEHIVQGARWAPGTVWTGAENFVLTGIRYPDRPARSKSLSWRTVERCACKNNQQQHTRCHQQLVFLSLNCNVGPAVAQLVEALRYKPEGRGFDSRRCRFNFSLTKSFRLTTLPPSSADCLEFWER
jgi:hypothetical protein